MSDYDPNYIPVYAQFLLSVKTIVYNDNDEILLLRRSEKSSRPHGWDFPGGGVDSGENPSDSVEREAFEETGVTVDNVQILSTQHGHHKEYEYVMLGYAAHTIDSVITLSWEHEDYKWMSITKAESVGLPETHLLILDAYKALKLS